MKALVHIGTTKTGSKTIQYFLEENRDKLLQHGLGYVQEFKQKNQIALVSLGDTAFDDCEAPADPRDRKRARAALSRASKRLKGHVEQVVLTCEILAEGLCCESSVHLFKQELERYFEEIEIILYLRRQDERALSYLSEGTKHGEVIPPAIFEDSLWLRRVRSYDYEALTSRWAAVFGEEALKVRPFEQTEFKGGSLIDDFLDICRISDFPETNNVLTRNKSMSAEVMLAMSSFNEVFTQRGGMANDLRYCILNQLNGSHPGQGLKPARQQAERFYSNFAESNRVVAEKYLGRTQLFSDDFSMYSDSAPNMQVDPKLLQEIIKLMADRLEQVGFLSQPAPNTKPRGLAKLRSKLERFWKKHICGKPVG